MTTFIFDNQYNITDGAVWSNFLFPKTILFDLEHMGIVSANEKIAKSLDRTGFLDGDEECILLNKYLGLFSMTELGTFKVWWICSSLDFSRERSCPRSAFFSTSAIKGVQMITWEADVCHTRYNSIVMAHFRKKR